MNVHECPEGEQGGANALPGFRPVAGRGGLGVRTPPELLRVTFLNRVNPETFCGG